MSMQSLVRNVRLAIRAEVLTAEIKLRVALRKTMLVLVALAVGLIAVVLLNIALYQYLVSLWGPLVTPLALAGFNIALALIASVSAAMAKPGPELEIAESLRKASATAMEEDLQSLGTAQGLFGLVSGGGRDHQALSLLVPLISTILGALRKKKAASK